MTDQHISKVHDRRSQPAVSNNNHLKSRRRRLILRIIVALMVFLIIAPSARSLWSFVRRRQLINQLSARIEKDGGRVYVYKQISILDYIPVIGAGNSLDDFRSDLLICFSDVSDFEMSLGLISQVGCDDCGLEFYRCHLTKSLFDVMPSPTPIPVVHINKCCLTVDSGDEPNLIQLPIKRLLVSTSKSTLNMGCGSPAIGTFQFVNADELIAFTPNGDDDATAILALAPQAQYIRLTGNFSEKSLHAFRGRKRLAKLEVVFPTQPRTISSDQDNQAGPERSESTLSADNAEETVSCGGTLAAVRLPSLTRLDLDNVPDVVHDISVFECLRLSDIRVDFCGRNTTADVCLSIDGDESASAINVRVFRCRPLLSMPQGRKLIGLYCEECLVTPELLEQAIQAGATQVTLTYCEGIDAVASQIMEITRRGGTVKVIGTRGK